MTSSLLPFTIRKARAGDEHVLFELIQALAGYEKLEHQVSGSAASLGQHLFRENPLVEALLAEIEGRAVGFALFFTNYSTFLTRPGIWLEDLFVLEAERRRGIGRALLLELTRIAKERCAGRLEWAVLDWNTSAIAFYERLGADVLTSWRICRTTLAEKK